MVVASRCDADPTPTASEPRPACPCPTTICRRRTNSILAKCAARAVRLIRLLAQSAPELFSRNHRLRSSADSFPGLSGSVEMLVGHLPRMMVTASFGAAPDPIPVPDCSGVAPCLPHPPVLENRRALA